MTKMLRSSKQELLDNAAALQKVTRFSDDMVIETETILSTFTKIGQNVMPDATEAVLDMATVMGGDSKEAAIQLGKALNDPVKGISALTRVGVTFTDEQERMIRKLVASGDVIGAQKIILKELQTEFGGAAVAAGDTFAGKIDILNNSVSDLFEAFGGYALPVLSQFIDIVTISIQNLSNIDPIFATLITGAGLLAVALSPVGAIIGAIATPIVAVTAAVIALSAAWQGDFLGIRTAVESAWSSIKPIFDRIGRAVQEFLLLFGVDTRQKLQLGTIEFGGGTLTSDEYKKMTWQQRQDYDQLKKSTAGIAESDGTRTTGTGFADQLASAFSKVGPKILAALGDLGSILSGWLNDGVNWLITNGPGLLDSALQSAVKFTGDVVTWFATNAPSLLNGLNDWIQDGVDWIIINGPGLISDGISKALNFAEDVTSWLSANAPDLAYMAGQWVNGAISWLLNTGKGLIESAVKLVFSGGGPAAGNPMGDLLGGNAMGLPAPDEGALSTMSNIISNVFKGTVDTIFSYFKGLFGLSEDWSIGKALEKGIADFKAGPLEKFKGAFRSAKDGIIDMFSGVANLLVSPFREALRLIGNALVSLNLDVLGVNTRDVGQTILSAIGQQDSGGGGRSGGGGGGGGRGFGFANGTNNFAGGWAQLSERGAEVAYLPSGTRVIRSSQVGGMGGANVTMNQHIYGVTDEQALGEAFIRFLRGRNIQIEGLTS